MSLLHLFDAPECTHRRPPGVFCGHAALLERLRKQVQMGIDFSGKIPLSLSGEKDVPEPDEELPAP